MRTKCCSKNMTKKKMRGCKKTKTRVKRWELSVGSGGREFQTFVTHATHSQMQWLRHTARKVFNQLTLSSPFVYKKYTRVLNISFCALSAGNMANICVQSEPRKIALAFLSSFWGTLLSSSFSRVQFICRGEDGWELEPGSRSRSGDIV